MLLETQLGPVPVLIARKAAARRRPTRLHRRVPGSASLYGVDPYATGIVFEQAWNIVRHLKKSDLGQRFAEVERLAGTDEEEAEVLLRDAFAKLVPCRQSATREMFDAGPLGSASWRLLLGRIYLVDTLIQTLCELRDEGKGCVRFVHGAPDVGVESFIRAGVEAALLLKPSLRLRPVPVRPGSARWHLEIREGLLPAAERLEEEGGTTPVFLLRTSRKEPLQWLRGISRDLEEEMNTEGDSPPLMVVGVTDLTNELRLEISRELRRCIDKWRSGCKPLVDGDQS